MAYFLDIQQTAQYYDAMMQVAAPSMEELGNPLHELRYEDLVAEPEVQLTALLNFLGLESDDAMLEYRQQGVGKTSDTPSYQQVSQPLHTRSIGRWRHYSEQFESSLSLISPWVTRFGYDDTSTPGSTDRSPEDRH